MVLSLCLACVDVEILFLHVFDVLHVVTVLKYHYIC